MRVEYLESLILYVSDLAAAKAFYVDALELPMVFEDDIVVVAGHGPTGVVLHRDDRGHDQPRFVVLADPDGRAVVLAEMNPGPPPTAKEAP